MTEYVLSISVIVIAVVWASYAFFDPVNSSLGTWATYFANFFGDGTTF